MEKTEIIIGQFTIERIDDKTFWISESDGEGGQFLEKDIERVIEKFYNDEL